MLDPDLVKPERIVPRRRLLSRRRYDKMVARGAIDERIELLRGQLVTQRRHGMSHSFVTGALATRLIRALDDPYRILLHSPFAATDDSEPQPDISVSRRTRRPHYHPSKALLLVEVSESSAPRDRSLKAEIYAENRAPEYWVVDLAAKAVVVHTEPVRGAYQSIVELRRRDLLQPRLLPDVAIRVSDVLSAR